MRILITNDDGINAPGLAVLDKIARDIAGPDGEVWTVAPAFEQSGVGHCISYTKPSMLSKFGERLYAVDGTPADCVLAAVHEVMKNAQPDLVLSGVNRGNNAGENVVYSGTLGAAMEGALQGLRAIALSQFYGPRNAKLTDPFEASAEYGAAIVRALLDKGLWSTGGYRLFYNVNFPPCPASDVDGHEITSQGFRENTRHAVEPHESPSGRYFLYVRGGPQDSDTGDGTDVAANLADRISITPLTADLTAHDVIAELRTRMA